MMNNTRPSGYAVILIFSILLLILSIPSVLAASTSTGVWEPPSMPSWAVPAAFAILIAVYTLIIFEVMHRALAAAVGGIAAVVTLHIIGDGPDLGTVVTWIDEETIGLLIGMMVIVDIKQHNIYNSVYINIYMLILHL